MKLDNEKIKVLLGIVAQTSDAEVSCQTCEDQIAQFAESQLAGNEVPEALKAIEEHLKLCPECTQELNYVKLALENEA